MHAHGTVSISLVRKGIRIGVLAILFLLVAVWPSLGRLPQKVIWSIEVGEVSSPLRAGKEKTSTSSMITYRSVTDVIAEGVADPFLFEQDSTFYLFFEVVNTEPVKQGDIGCASSTDGVHWTYHKVVLNEPFHLSYPQVFAWEGEIWMVPETNQTSTVRLYRAVNFPDEWEFDRTLLDERIADPSLLHHEGNWYLFGATNPADHWNTTRLFVAPELVGPWVEHPSSPVHSGDNNYSRPGGRVLTIDGSIFRFVQDGVPKYGRQLFAFEISRLTPKVIEESLHSEDPVLTAGARAYGTKGMHHLDAVQLPSGKWLCAIDGKSSQRYHRPRIKPKKPTPRR